MKKKKTKEREMARAVYVSPQMEVYRAESNRLLAGTFSGTHEDGADDGEITGAKRTNLDISFREIWEE